ncbi:MAG: hypothetical protein JJT82_09770 [Legionellaceae bacterium]|nr:hypothetical protein [Legionellaceae bacterium]
MKFFKPLFLTLILGYSCAPMAAVQDMYYRIFWNPDLNGKRLAYCYADGKSCGKRVADQFCHKLGYEKSVEHIEAHNVGLTHFIDAPIRCRGWNCQGFKAIRCAAQIPHKPPKQWHYRFQKFVYPRFENYRVDWCYDGKSGCGRRAAFSFCRQMGFYNVKSFQRQDKIAATRAIGNQKLCFQTGCTGFSYIDCSR